MKRSNWIKMSVTIALLVVLFWKIDLSAIASQFYSFDPVWYFASVSLGLAMTWGQAMRWRDLMEGNGDVPSRKNALKLTLIGYFFNLLLPSSVGGDVVKSMLYNPGIASRTNAMASALASRILGALVLCLFFWSSCVLIGFPVESIMCFTMTAATFGIIVFSVLFTMGVWKRLIPVTIAQKHPEILGLSWSFAKMMRVFPGTVAVQILVVFSQYAYFKAVGVDVGIVTLLQVVPFVNLVTMLPVSLNGVGVREWAIFVSFGQLESIGVGAAMASTVVAYSIVLLQALVGWLLYMIQQSSATKGVK